MPEPAQEVLEHLLRGLGHAIHTAQDGKTGLARAISLRPQIIISDWIMPGLDGLALCKALRQTEEGQQMYFIILSALEQDDQLVEAFESGVDDYLTKPFTPRVLAARLRAGLRVIHLQEEARRDSENLRKFAAELAVANRRLQQAALTDPLTGLPGRRALEERMRGLGSRFALAMVDVDHFKKFNDTHGHDIGDQVLKLVGARLGEVGGGGIAYRYGGEEFSVLFPRAKLNDALPHLEALRASIEGYRMAVRSSDRPKLAEHGTKRRGEGAAEQSLSVTVSIGACAPRKDVRTPAQVIKAADEALYRAKQGGRNRVST